MRRVVIPLPAADGLITDQAPYTLPPSAAITLNDAIVDEGILRQRRGWTYVHQGATFVARQLAVAYVDFELRNTTKLLTVSRDVGGSGPIELYSATDTSDIATLISAASPRYFPRCVYNDELILCCEDGLRPLIRYSGGESGVQSGSNGVIAIGGKGVGAAGTPFSGGGKGKFLSFTPQRPGVGLPAWPRMYWRTTSDSKPSFRTLEAMKSSVAYASLVFSVDPIGYAYPCVPLPSPGSVTCDGTNIVGTETLFTAPPATGGLAMILRPPTGASEHVPLLSISTAAAATTLATNFSTTVLDYTMTARCPFTDAQVHRGSLWGLGNAHEPNRIYVAPPGWRMGLPPGFAALEAVDVGDVPTTFDPSEYTLAPFDVPGPGDDDPAVAFISTEGPMLVAKRDSVHRIDGAYPNFTQRVVARGIGCARPQARVSADQGGPFWADKRGVYTWDGATVRDLTEGRIADEYRSNVATYPEITLGVYDGKLIVSLTQDPADFSSNAGVTYHYDIARRIWMGKLSNVGASSMWLDRQGDRLLAIRTNDGPNKYVANLAPMYAEAGTIHDADGSIPAFFYTSGRAITANKDGVDTDRILADVRVTMVHSDPDPTPASTVDLIVSSLNPLNGSDATTTHALVTAGSSSSTSAKAFESSPNAHGRQQSVGIRRQNGMDSGGEFSVGQIVIDVIDASGGT